MADAKSPFSGMKLTDQTPIEPGGLDQRLFAPAAQPQSPAPTTPPRVTDRPVSTHATTPSTTPQGKALGPRPNVRTMIRSNERPNVRTNIRHSFDCWADQLIALRQIGMDRELLSGERVTLGDLVKEALDRFIATERSNERPEK